MPRDYNTSTVEGAAAHAASLAAPYDRFADYPGPDLEDLPDPVPQVIAKISTYRDLLNSLQNLTNSELDLDATALMDGEAYDLELVYFEEDDVVDSCHPLLSILI